jgi:succinate dehydrogenase / fumarate reductase membrane anchor subunit
MTTEVQAAQAAVQAPAAPAASGHDAAHHWGLERMLSVTTLLLFVWFFVSLWRLPGLDQQTVAEWLKNPLAAVPMLLLIVSTFWHLKLGLVVVVEDYVHEAGNRFGWVLVITLASLFAAGLAIVSVLKLAVGAAAA